MAKYTLELRQLVSDPLFNLFDFDYEFYCDDIEVKKYFEKKFIQHYFFREIGFETIARFKYHLKSTLDLKMKYYTQLYKTELDSKDINFLLNKDYTETFIKEIDKNSVGDSSSNLKNNSNSNSNFKESSIDNGNANLSNDSLTTISENGVNNLDNSEQNSNSIINENEKESTTLVGKGNIGVTSSAELLEKWRATIINIDELLINEFKDLFMMIY